MSSSIDSREVLAILSSCRGLEGTLGGRSNERDSEQMSEAKRGVVKLDVDTKSSPKAKARSKVRCMKSRDGLKVFLDHSLCLLLLALEQSVYIRRHLSSL